MYAIVESGSITKQFNNPKRITINNIRYSTKIYSLWTVEEKEAIGLYEVEYDETNKKDENFYINTGITIAYDSSADKVTGTYGTATPKPLADTLWTEQNKTDGIIREGEDVGDVANKGLKTIHKEMINFECSSLLSTSDWMVIRAKETGATMNSGWKTWRASVRTKCNSMQTEIDGASNVADLVTLLTYTEQEDGTITRPLGVFPIKS